MMLMFSNKLALLLFVYFHLPRLDEAHFVRFNRHLIFLTPFVEGDTTEVLGTWGLSLQNLFIRKKRRADVKLQKMLTSLKNSDDMRWMIYYKIHIEIREGCDALQKIN